MTFATDSQYDAAPSETTDGLSPETAPTVNFNNDLSQGLISDPVAIRALLDKYNTAGPRYTSYPTAPVWREDYTAETHERAVKESNEGGRPLSIYTHLPFCESRCLFCGCNVVITRRREEVDKYLGYLFREIETIAGWLDSDRPVVQLHWGGGTPTYLSEKEMERLFGFLTKHFQLAPDAEVAIEIDPRVTTPSQLSVLRDLGFNRISLGVQDFDEDVQEAIHRIQPLAMTARMVEQCRDLGFEEGLNFDLIYGLPKQTVAGFSKTLNEVIALNPDRIALYSYAHVPWLSPHQAHMPESTLPTTEVKFALLQLALQRLTEAGYRYIGMDHFARPEDALSQALDKGGLHRNFMGYTVQSRTGSTVSDLHGFGVSAISGLQGHFSQNQRTLAKYYETLEQGQLPVMRGYTLNEDDQLRQQVILQILCQGRIDYADFEEHFSIRFQNYFAPAIEKLETMANDGLVDFSGASGFRVTPLGRLFSRNIAMPFDAYLPKMSGAKPTFSKTV
jgi:oxygen-independent coproporphyrinogen III oxidase